MKQFYHVEIKSHIAYKLYCLSVARNSCIRGFNFNTVEIKSLAYGDDIAVFYSDSECSSELIRTTKTLCGASRAAVNLKKTCCFLYGGWDAASGASESIR